MQNRIVQIVGLSALILLDGALAVRGMRLWRMYDARAKQEELAFRPNRIESLKSFGPTGLTALSGWPVGANIVAVFGLHAGREQSELAVWYAVKARIRDRGIRLVGCCLDRECRGPNDGSIVIVADGSYLLGRTVASYDDEGQFVACRRDGVVTPIRLPADSGDVETTAAALLRLGN